MFLDRRVEDAKTHASGVALAREIPVRQRRTVEIDRLTLGQVFDEKVALEHARAAKRAGLKDVGVLTSSQYASLHPDYYVVFQGIYASEADEAQTTPEGEWIVLRYTFPTRLDEARFAVVARVTRASIREEGGREHVQTAVSRGIPARKVIQRHILRNAAIPIPRLPVSRSRR